MKKKLMWVGSSKEDLSSFPREVVQCLGYKLDAVQNGVQPVGAKPLKGFNGVSEITERFDTDAYRTVYIAKLKNAVYVLHCFQKKSKSGIKTPPKDLDLIKERLRRAIKTDNELEG